MQPMLPIFQGLYTFAIVLRLGGEIEIGAAHEVVAAGAAEFALLVDEFVAALEAVTPVFARMVSGGKGARFGFGTTGYSVEGGRP